MRIAFAVLALAASLTAQAQCVGSGTFQTCMDSSGNTYNIQRFGNTSYMDGSNARTGTRWDQTSTTFGNTTYHDGTASNGQRWSGSTTNLGGMQIHQGTDSRGQPYSRTCTQWGCF